jgi:hypothetical protein
MDETVIQILGFWFRESYFNTYKYIRDATVSSLLFEQHL